MILDSLSTYADGKTISGTSIDTDTIDHGKAGKFAETQMYVIASFDTASHGATLVTLSGSSDNSTFTALGSRAVSDQTAGASVAIPLPQGCPRYTKVTISGSSMTGKVSVYFSLKPTSPRGFRIGNFAARASV